MARKKERQDWSEIQRASLGQGEKIAARCLKFDADGGVCLLPLVAREDYLQSSVNTFRESGGKVVQTSTQSGLNFSKCAVTSSFYDLVTWQAILWGGWRHKKYWLFEDRTIASSDDNSHEDGEEKQRLQSDTLWRPHCPCAWSDHQKVIWGRCHLQLILSAELEKLDNLEINSLFSSASPPTSSSGIHHVQQGRQTESVWVRVWVSE